MKEADLSGSGQRQIPFLTLRVSASPREVVVVVFPSGHLRPSASSADDLLSSLRPSDTLYLCHFVTLSLCHFVTLSLCHFVTLSLCHSATLSLSPSVPPSLRPSVSPSPTLSIWAICATCGLSMTGAYHAPEEWAKNRPRMPQVSPRITQVSLRIVQVSASFSKFQQVSTSFGQVSSCPS